MKRRSVSGLEACWRALGPEQQESLFREALAKADSFNAKQYRRHEGSGSPFEKLYRDVILEPYLGRCWTTRPCPKGTPPAETDPRARGRPARLAGSHVLRRPRPPQYPRGCPALPWPG